MDRNRNVDLLRFICAFLVVCIHTPFPGKIGEMFGVFTRIAVPIFFIISGYFHNHLAENNLLIKSLKKAITIFFVANVFYLLWGIIVEVIKGDVLLLNYINSLIDIRKIILFIVTNQSMLKEHLWFLGAYIYVIGIAILFEKLKIRRWVIYVIALCLLILGEMLGTYSLLVFGISLPVCFTRNFLFVGIPFYYIGVYICHNKGQINNISSLVYGILAIISFLLSVVEKSVLSYKGMLPEREHFIGTSFCAVAVFYLFINLPHVDKSKKKIGYFFSTLGRDCAAIIYVIHPTVIFVFAYIADRFHIVFWYRFLAPVIVFFISTIGAWLINIFRNLVKGKKNE